MDKEIEAFESSWKDRDLNHTPKNWAISAFYLGMEVQNQKKQVVKIKPETAKDILSSVSTSEKLEAFSDEKIADFLLEFIWAGFDILSPESDLLDEAIKRLKAKTKTNKPKGE